MNLFELSSQTKTQRHFSQRMLRVIFHASSSLFRHPLKRLDLESISYCCSMRRHLSARELGRRAVIHTFVSALGW